MPSKLIKGALSALRKEPEEKKMLQGFYRGFAGEGGANPEVFVTPQKRVADYYAQKRAGQTGQEPHAEMVLADPFAGRAYGHSTPGTGKQEPLFTRARKMRESDVVDRTSLYAGGGIVRGMAKAVGRAAESAGMKAPTVANKDLTTLQDTHTMLGDRVRAEAELARKMMEEFDYKYDKGQRVFTQDSSAKNRVPYEVLGRTRTGNQIMYDTGGGGMKARKDPETGKAMRTPYEPGYRVRSQQGDDVMEFVIPQSAIRGDVEMAKGGLVAAFQDGGAAFGVFPQMRPRRAENSGTGDRMTEEALKFMIPQDTLDLALMALPFGKAGKAAAAGLMALTPSDAEAGKLKTGVDLARRSFFGLKPSQDMAGRELAPVQRDMDRMRAELNRAEKAAPKVEERSVSIDPGKGSAKIVDTVQKVASTPVSRRTVLKSATGQVLQNALPMQSFADLMKPVEVVKQAAQAVAPTSTPFGMPGMIAAGLREGMSEDDVAKMVLGTYRTVSPEKVERTVGSIKDPSSIAFEEPVGAGRAMMDLIGTEGPPIANRGALRYMRHIDPAKYDELRQTAKDVAEYGFEP